METRIASELAACPRCDEAMVVYEYKGKWAFECEMCECARFSTREEAVTAANARAPMSVAPLVVLAEKWARDGDGFGDDWHCDDETGPDAILYQCVDELRAVIASLGGLSPRQAKILAAADAYREATDAKAKADAGYPYHRAQSKVEDMEAQLCDIAALEGE